MTPDNGKINVMKKIIRITAALVLALLITSTALQSFAADTVSTDKFKDIRLCPGGMPFGVRINTEGVLVAGISDVDTDKGNVSPGRNADIRCGDIILEADSVKVTNARQLMDAA